MKELSIEEKAQAYDEVVNKLRHFIKQGVNPLITRADVQDFFPELKESEDEKIRKEITTYLKSVIANKGYEDKIIESWIAWLERQGKYEKGLLQELDDKLNNTLENITDEELAKAKKDAYNNALDKIEYHSGEPTFDDGWSAAIWHLKKRNVQSQNRWKPYDYQMDAFIEKGLKFLDEYFFFNNIRYSIESEVFDSKEEMFEDFKKYIKK